MPQNLARNIPHRPPMHWLNDATREPDGTILATCKLSAGQPFIINGLLPRTALLEMAAQAAACGIAPENAGAPPRFGVLAALRDVHFFETPRTGQTIAIRVRVEKSMASLVLCSIQATTDGRPVLAGTFTFALPGDRPPAAQRPGSQAD